VGTEHGRRALIGRALAFTSLGMSLLSFAVFLVVADFRLISDDLGGASRPLSLVSVVLGIAAIPAAVAALLACRDRVATFALVVGCGHVLLHVLIT